MQAFVNNFNRPRGGTSVSQHSLHTLPGDTENRNGGAPSAGGRKWFSLCSGNTVESDVESRREVTATAPAQEHSSLLSASHSSYSPISHSINTDGEGEQSSSCVETVSCPSVKFDSLETCRKKSAFIVNDIGMNTVLLATGWGYALKEFGPHNPNPMYGLSAVMGVLLLLNLKGPLRLGRDLWSEIKNFLKSGDTAMPVSYQITALLTVLLGAIFQEFTYPLEGGDSIFYNVWVGVSFIFLLSSLLPSFFKLGVIGALKCMGAQSLSRLSSGPLPLSHTKELYIELKKIFSGVKILMVYSIINRIIVEDNGEDLNQNVYLGFAVCATVMQALEYLLTGIVTKYEDSLESLFESRS